MAKLRICAMTRPGYLRSSIHLIAAIVTICATIGPVCFGQQSIPDSVEVKTWRQVTKVYSSPNNSIVVGFLEKGVSPEILEYGISHIQIRHGDVEGWVDQYALNGLVRPAGASIDELKQDLDRKRQQINSTLLRELPKQGFGILILNIETLTSDVRGAGLSIDFVNADGARTIKYLRVAASPFNRVGDQVQASSLDYESAEFVGPIFPGDESNAEVWLWRFSDVIDCALVTRIEVEYMDGSQFVYMNDIPKILGFGVRNSCAVQF